MFFVKPECTTWKQYCIIKGKRTGDREQYGLHGKGKTVQILRADSLAGTTWR